MTREVNSSGIEVDVKDKGMPKDSLITGSSAKKKIAKVDEMETLLDMEYIALVDASYRTQPTYPAR